MKEVKRKFKERDEIEVYFSDIKKRNFPIRIIFILLFFLIVGGVIYYLLVLVSPQNLFLNSLNKLSNNIKINYTHYEKGNIDFSLDLNLITEKKEYVDLTNIINEMSITGNFGTDFEKREDYLNINALYQEKDLFGVTGYFVKNNIYIKLDNIFDKVLKDELTEEEVKEFDKIYDLYKEEEGKTKIIIDSLTKHLTNTLNEANYKKEYLKQDKTYIKKITLTINKELVEVFCNKLLNDKEFLENYSKTIDIKQSELEKQLKELINKMDNQTIEVSLYLSILKNEFIKLEINFNDIRISITKEDDVLNYKYYESSIIKYQGYISIKDKDYNYQISLSIEDIEQEIILELNSDITLELDKNINTLDTTNAIEIDNLTEKDYNKIMSNISNNKNLKDLLEDFKSLFAIYSNEENYFQTT